MNVDQNSPLGFFQANRNALETSMRHAVQDAMREHKAFGNPVPIWHDGKVVILPPEKIELTDDLNGNVNGAKNGTN